jgi:uncharacterized protein YndB with AHSA1/START domain
MTTNLIAKATITINAPISKVWEALVKPEAIQQYMFGTQVASDWRVGSPIFWRGEWQGKPYEDKGVILEIKPGQILQYSHFSPLAGVPDEPANYHTVTIVLSGEPHQTLVALAQDNNATDEERDHSAKNWEMMLKSLKAYVEK